MLSDLKAQVAANAKGIALLHELIREHGRRAVLSYMGHVQDNAAACVRSMLREYAARIRADGEATLDNNGGGGGVLTVRAADQMDDGSPIELQLTIDETRGLCRFDFGGTGAQVHGNWNAPSAVTTAAVIYCLRLLVGREIPLNSGCLEPVTIDIPAGSMLSPAADAAVCAGNVLTSQRVTDVILKAFGAAAASQGCMNNFTFGDAGFGYYETIAGGSGAGPSWEGTSAVQCHMTNTRMTDVEIMEKRYPVVVDTFALRRGSGGAGARGGGCGVVREVTFLRDGITASLLTERRAVALRSRRRRPARAAATRCSAGGGARRAARRVALGIKCKFAVGRGDTVHLSTPGGGGHGAGDGGGGGRSGRASRTRRAAAAAADGVDGVELERRRVLIRNYVARRAMS